MPDTAGRYYVLQFVDAWTNNFAYVGSRATGTSAGSFLLVPPGRRMAAPDGARAIGFPAMVATIVGRCRYSIGDRTAGLQRDDDGSVTILIQHDQPAGASNWLPAPRAPFRPIMRLYQPRPDVLDGRYQIPPIRKAAP